MAAESPPPGSSKDDTGLDRTADNHDHDTSLKLLQLGIAATENETNLNITLSQQHEQLLRDCSESSDSTADDVVQQGEHVRDMCTQEGNGFSHGCHTRVTTLSAGIDARNIIVPREEEEELELGKSQLTSFVAKSAYTLRSRHAKQSSKLIYDLKYHPMDDSVRPSQAARRRSAHGEEQLLSDDSCNTASEHPDTDVDDSMQGSDDSEPEEKTKHSTRNKKRTLAQPKATAPTRRSSRRTANPKSAYNMKIHPQDSDLRILSDDEDEVRSPLSKRRKLRCTPPIIEIDSDNESAMATGMGHHESDQDAGITISDETIVDGETTRGANRGPTNKMSTSSQVVASPPSHAIRLREGMDVWKMPAGSRYFRHERDSWAFAPGQPFEIFTESLEDQLAAEALALSPLNYKHDDKENNVQDPGLRPAPNSLAGGSVVPNPLYRRRRANSQTIQEIPLVNHALYDTLEEDRRPYGFNSSDTTEDGPPII